MPPRPAVSMTMVPGAAVLASEFRSWGGQIGELNEPLQTAIDNIVAPSIATNFEQGGRPPWASLSPQTIQRRSGGGPVLTDTGSLRAIASSPSIWEVRGDTASIPVTALGAAAYGAFHQSGTRNMPQREWAVVQAQDIDQIEEMFGDWVGVTAARAGVVGKFLGTFGRLFGRGR